MNLLFAYKRLNARKGDAESMPSSDVKDVDCQFLKRLHNHELINRLIIKLKFNRSHISIEFNIVKTNFFSNSLTAKRHCYLNLSTDSK